MTELDAGRVGTPALLRPDVAARNCELTDELLPPQTLGNRRDRSGEVT